jgi:outer membrane biosynthesis protein TonB
MVKRAAPLPAPPAEIADADLTFVVPIRFTAGQQR